jgi:polar amino acid transport system substrate-binding protein
MRPAIVTAVVIAALTALLAGCGATSNQALKMSLAALATKPPSSAPASGSSAADNRGCGDVTASLRPPAVMPAPRAMPKGSFMRTIQNSGRLVAGVDQNTLLLAYFNPIDRRIEGFEIDILQRIADAIFGHKRNDLAPVPITTAQRISAIQGQSVDLVADAMTVTCARRRQVDFSTIYLDAKQEVLVQTDSSARTVRDLAGKRICAATGTTSLTTLEQQTPRMIPYPEPQRIDCLVALQEGRVDGITSDDSILLGFHAQDPHYTKLVRGTLANEPYGIAINKAHPDFVRFVNGVLARLRSDGAWRRIYAKWFGGVTATPSPPTAHYGG